MISLASLIQSINKKIANLTKTLENETCSKEYVDNKIADLVNGAPEQLDTLQELSKALNNDKDFAATVNNSIAKKLNLTGGTITGDLTVEGTLTAKASTAGTADRALKADVCTGNAATASSVDWSGITNKPTSFTPAAHNHDDAYPSTTGARASGTWSINVTGTANSLSKFFTSDSAAPKNCNDMTSNSVCYYTSGGPAISLGASTDDGALYSQAYSTAWVGQIAQDYRNGSLFVRGKNNGTWTAWKRMVWNEGTWNINVTGSAGSVAWDNVSGKPSSMLKVSGWDASTGKLELTNV